VLRVMGVLRYDEALAAKVGAGGGMSRGGPVGVGSGGVGWWHGAGRGRAGWSYQNEAHSSNAFF
jgi:hypothetical protein